MSPHEKPAHQEKPKQQETAEDRPLTDTELGRVSGGAEPVSGPLRAEPVSTPRKL